jgi:hypothetical protein
MGEKSGGYRALVGKPQKKMPLERPGHKWENNIKVYFKVKDESGLKLSFL